MLLIDIFTLLPSESMNSVSMTSIRVKQEMQFFFFSQSKYMNCVRLWWIAQKDFCLFLEQDNPPFSSTFSKFNTTSSEIYLQKGLFFNLKGQMLLQVELLLFSIFLQPDTSSSSPLSTKKQKRASMGIFSAKKRQNILKAQSLIMQKLRESMKLTKSCSILSLSFIIRIMFLQNHSEKLSFFMCTDFFLFQFQNLSQVSYISSQSCRQDSFLGQMQTQT